MFVATTPYTGKKAAAVLLDADEPPRFDWVVRGSEFWSFEDPRNSACHRIVDSDQVEAIDTEELAFHEDSEDQNNFIYLLNSTLKHQVRADLSWSKDRKLLYFRALHADTSRTFSYDASKKRTEAVVVNVAISKKEAGRVDFVRHHAFHLRFERLGDQWFLLVNPTYYLTTNDFIPHFYPAALLAGKKRMDNSASLRGQVIMWHRLLTSAQRQAGGLFGDEDTSARYLSFGDPPVIGLRTRVPEDVWGSPKKKAEEPTAQIRLIG